MELTSQYGRIGHDLRLQNLAAAGGKRRGRNGQFDNVGRRAGRRAGRNGRFN